MKSAKHLPAMWPSTAISPAALACAAGLWLVAFDNLGFWRALWAARAPSSLHGALAVAGLALVLWSLFALLAIVIAGYAVTVLAVRTLYLHRQQPLL